jgi:CRP-like cAMP-binding protein
MSLLSCSSSPVKCNFVTSERDLVLTDAGPGTILGELAVLCGMPRSASVRASEKSAVLQWSAAAFRSLLLRDAFLSQRIFESLRTLIGKERSLIDSLSVRKAAATQVHSATEQHGDKSTAC